MTTSRQTPRMLSLDLLIENAQNVRADVGDTSELAASIRQHGLVQPIVVTEHPTRAGRFLILAGHRRVAAAGSIGLGQVPCIVRHEAGTRDDHIALMLVENMQRSGLTAVEKARAMGKLVDHGMTQTEIARRLAITPASVSSYLMLLDLSDEELAQIEADEVKLGDARAAVKAARREKRAQVGGRRMGRRHSAHFSEAHPLADRARTACDHSDRQLIGRLACGQCWEAAIRQDALDEYDRDVEAESLTIGDAPVQVVAS